ncbi:MAG: D-2-hydroxyacid dehydrogenase, partial [Ruminococcus sp.]|nr:D-2-hydroxyacid dehydrogenase [Candidatus Copronaster equi]
ELVVERCKDADVVIDNKVIINADIIEQLPKLKYIGLLSTGFNVIDIEAAKAHGITVCNVPTYSTNAVAQLTFALILETYNQVGLHSKAVHSGEWASNVDFCFQKAPLIELSGKTIGIIGYGKIGSEVAKIADAFSMNILCYVPHEKPQPDFKSFKFVSLDTLAEKSDIISLHCPLTPQTEKMINAEFIDKMKKNAIIINTSRGQAVDEQALADAINSGRIYGAGVDVLSTEPPKADNPLLSCEKCFITPHIAWAGYETRVRLIDVVYNNLKAYSENNPVNVVNK